MRDKLLTLEELMEKLGVNSKKTIYNLRKKGMPTLQASNRIIRFDFDEVKNWMRNESPNTERKDDNE